MTIFLSSGEAAAPCFKATDLVFKAYHHFFDHFDVSRQTSVNIAELRKKLLPGKKKLAYFPAMAYLRLKKE
ncbi:hypothetical protein LTS12_029489 [Elasticomyces elasticus]|nr:hypothetical protein LTS12_029489 [Elasticomyces elasticus]